MILHSVYLRLGPIHDAAELTAVMAGLRVLCAGLPECVDFHHGPNVDMEGKSSDYPYGFVVTFDSISGLADYAQNPLHKAFGARLQALCEGGGDGIVVYDLDTATP